MAIICEIGSNHEGSLTRAKEMIHAVAENGGDIAKFQLFKPEQYPHNIAIPEDWIDPLREETAKVGIGLLFSVFYSTEWNLGTVKIAYSQRHNFALIRWWEMKGMKLIVSGDSNTIWPKDCIRLACVPKYPAEEKDYAFAVGNRLFNGLSDHTVGIDFAIKSNSPILEKHFKLGDEKKSLDAGPFAMTPAELKELSKCLKV